MKINFKAIGKTIAKTSKRAAPAVAIVTGAFATAYASYKMAKKIPVAKQHIAEKKAELNKEKLTIKETVQACGKDLLEPVAIGAAGIAGVVGGVCGYEKTVTTLTNAVGVATALITEQDNALVQAVGAEKAKEIRQAAMENLQPGEQNPDIQSIGVAMTPYPNELFLEPITGRWLMSSEDWLTTVALQVYRKAVKSAFVDPIMLEDLYSAWVAGGAGATDSDLASCIGWSCKTVDNCNPIDMRFEPCRMSNGRLYKKICQNIPAEFIYAK